MVLYRVDDAKLKHLDVLEDYPRLYDRIEEQINMEGSEQVS